MQKIFESIAIPGTQSGDFFAPGSLLLKRAIDDSYYCNHEGKGAIILSGAGLP